MDDLLDRMNDLLEAARRQGIADALKAVQDYRADLGEDFGQQYLDGIDDAVITIEKL